MKFMEINISDVLILKGIAVGMDIDSQGNTYYIMMLVSNDVNGDEVKTTFAIPPTMTEQFLGVVKCMEPMRE